MRRRPFLIAAAGLLSVGLGGCSGSSGNPAATPASELTAVVDVAPISYSGIARRVTYDLDDHQRRLLASVVENGSATVEASDPMLPEGRPLLFDDAVYQTSFTATNSHRAFRYSFSVDPLQEEPSDAETIRFGDLPQVDRQKLSAVQNGTRLGIGFPVQYTASERNRSKLVPTPERAVVVWGADRKGRISVANGSERTVETYEYSAEAVAATATSYGRRIFDRYGFELTNLPASEREIVEQAIDGEYRVEPDTPPTGALTSLVGRFRSQDPLRTQANSAVSGTYLLEFEGRPYRMELYLDEEEF